MSSKEFNQQLLNYQNPLNAFAMSLTQDYEDAKDLAQETMIKALLYKSRYKEEFNFKSWIFTIMRNSFFNIHKRKKKTHLIFSDQDVAEILSSDDDYSPESYFNYNEIQNTINTLDSAYRVPFEKYNQGYKYREIAEQMNLEIGTVKSRIFFARKRLSAILIDYRS
jgi:RNA polymerase sigma factor (sigma-70 family)|tara:strand:+ start:456 stop:953 length:498 start_codon:yes stop_codon:yes gene_type:complete